MKDPQPSSLYYSSPEDSSPEDEIKPSDKFQITPFDNACDHLLLESSSPKNIFQLLFQYKASNSKEEKFKIFMDLISQGADINKELEDDKNLESELSKFFDLKKDDEDFKYFKDNTLFKLGEFKNYLQHLPEVERVPELREKYIKSINNLIKITDLYKDQLKALTPNSNPMEIFFTKTSQEVFFSEKQPEEIENILNYLGFLSYLNDSGFISFLYKKIEQQLEHPEESVLEGEKKLCNSINTLIEILPDFFKLKQDQKNHLQKMAKLIDKDDLEYLKKQNEILSRYCKALEAQVIAKEQGEAKVREAKVKPKTKSQTKAEAKAEAKAKVKAIRDDELKAKRDALAIAKKEAEEKARKEAEEKTRKEVEEKAKKEAEAKTAKEAKEIAKRLKTEERRQKYLEKIKLEDEDKIKFEASEKLISKVVTEFLYKALIEAYAEIEAEKRAKIEAEKRAEIEAEEIKDRILEKTSANFKEFQPFFDHLRDVKWLEIGEIGLFGSRVYREVIKETCSSIKIPENPQADFDFFCTPKGESSIGIFALCHDELASRENFQGIIRDFNAKNPNFQIFLKDEKIADKKEDGDIDEVGKKSVNFLANRSLNFKLVAIILDDGIEEGGSTEEGVVEKKIGKKNRV